MKISVCASRCVSDSDFAVSSRVISDPRAHVDSTSIGGNKTARSRGARRFHSIIERRFNGRAGFSLSPAATRCRASRVRSILPGGEIFFRDTARRFRDAELSAPRGRRRARGARSPLFREATLRTHGAISPLFQQEKPVKSHRKIIPFHRPSNAFYEAIRRSDKEERDANGERSRGISILVKSSPSPLSLRETEGDVQDNCWLKHFLFA